MRFPTGGDSPRLPGIQGLNRWNSGTDGIVRMEEGGVADGGKPDSARDRYRACIALGAVECSGFCYVEQ